MSDFGAFAWAKNLFVVVPFAASAAFAPLVFAASYAVMVAAFVGAASAAFAFAADIGDIAAHTPAGDQNHALAMDFGVDNIALDFENYCGKMT